jgi:hypothetical protein
MIFYKLKNIVKNYSEILILSFIITSFFIFHFLFQTEKEGVCVSRPFSTNKKPRSTANASNPNEKISSASSSSTQDMIQAYVSIIDLIQSDMRFIKSIIPVNFALGVVNNNDNPSNITTYGNLPNIFLNFSIQNPPYGPTGLNGNNAAPYGNTGKVGPTGNIGETGYWGTTKNALY